MFEMVETRVYEGLKVEEIYAPVIEFWRYQGFFLSSISQYQIHGQSYKQDIGLRKEFYLAMLPEDNNLRFELHVKGSITDEGFLGALISAVVFLPITAVLAGVSYLDYRNSVSLLFTSFWNFLDSKGKPVVPPSPPSPSLQGATGTLSVKQGEGSSSAGIKCICGAGIQNGWTHCPYCGSPVEAGKAKPEKPVKEEKEEKAHEVREVVPLKKETAGIKDEKARRDLIEKKQEEDAKKEDEKKKT